MPTGAAAVDLAMEASAGLEVEKEAILMFQEAEIQAEEAALIANFWALRLCDFWKQFDLIKPRVMDWDSDHWLSKRRVQLNVCVMNVDVSLCVSGRRPTEMHVCHLLHCQIVSCE